MNAALQLFHNEHSARAKPHDPAPDYFGDAISRGFPPKIRVFAFEYKSRRVSATRADVEANLRFVYLDFHCRRRRGDHVRSCSADSKIIVPATPR